MAWQGTDVAFLKLTPLHLYLLLNHFVCCYKSSQVTSGMTRFSSTEETGERLGSVLLSLSGFFSCQSLLSQESHKQDQVPPIHCHQIHLVLIFRAVSRGHSPNARICYCPCELQQAKGFWWLWLEGDFIFLSFFMVLNNRNSLLHVETDIKMDNK